MKSKIKASERTVLQRIDSILAPVHAEIANANIACYFVWKNRAVAAFFTLADSTTHIISVSITNNTIDSTIKSDLLPKEVNEFSKCIGQTKPSELLSNEDQLVDDGYTAIVNINDKGKTNLFSVRVFGAKGKKSPQYKFIATVAKLLKKKGMAVIIGD